MVNITGVNKMKIIKHDFNANTITVKTREGDTMEIPHALTKAQRTKITRTLARKIFKISARHVK